MIVVACVLAPLVEEIMFRGALYQHLREIGPGMAKWASVTFSVFVSGFVFAAIHPQGWLGLPVLMSLATAFALSREWRGSLLPAMIAHGNQQRDEYAHAADVRGVSKRQRSRG